MFRRLIGAGFLFNQCRLLARVGAKPLLSIGTTTRLRDAYHGAARRAMSANAAVQSQSPKNVDEHHPSLVEFWSVLNDQQSTGYDILSALANHCAEAPSPSTKVFYKALRSRQAQEDPMLINDMLRLSLKHDMHLSVAVYIIALRAALPAPDIELMLALLQHELVIDPNSASTLFFGALRAINVMPRSDPSFATLVRTLHSHLPHVHKHLPVQQLAGTYSVLSTMMAEIGVCDVAVELLGQRAKLSPISERVLTKLLLYLCYNDDVEHVMEIFTNAPTILGVRPRAGAYRGILDGLCTMGYYSELLSVVSSFVHELQHDAGMFMTESHVRQMAKGFMHWSPADIEAKQAILLLRLFFNAVVAGRSNVQHCVEHVSEALRVLGDLDGAVQLFEALEDWDNVDKSVPFFDLPIDPRIASIAKPWLAKPLLSDTHIANMERLHPTYPFARNNVHTAATQVHILIDRDQLHEAIRLMTQYPNIDQHDLVRHAVDNGGVEAGLRMLDIIDLATANNLRFQAAHPVLLWYYSNRQDRAASAVLERFRRRNINMSASFSTGMFLNSIADAGRDELADEMFFDLDTSFHDAWCYTATFTLWRWYCEEKTELVDALTKHCLERVDGPLPPRLWRTIAAINHRLGERDDAVAAALQHDKGRDSYNNVFTLESLVKLLDLYTLRKSAKFVARFD